MKDEKKMIHNLKQMLSKLKVNKEKVNDISSPQYKCKNCGMIFKDIFTAGNHSKHCEDSEFEYLGE